MDPDRRGGVEELGKVEEGENVNRKKSTVWEENLFSIKGSEWNIQNIIK